MEIDRFACNARADCCHQFFLAPLLEAFRSLTAEFYCYIDVLVRYLLLVDA